MISTCVKGLKKTKKNGWVIQVLPHLQTSHSLIGCTDSVRFSNHEASVFAHLSQLGESGGGSDSSRSRKPQRYFLLRRNAFLSSFVLPFVPLWRHLLKPQDSTVEYYKSIHEKRPFELTADTATLVETQPFLHGVKKTKNSKVSSVLYLLCACTVVS